MKRRRMTSNVVFLDLIMNALLCFVALFILAFVQMNPKAEKDPVLETEGKYVVIMEWEDGSTADVDLYVQDPTGRIAFYQSRDVGLMHLEYDDRGSLSDSVRTESGDVTVDRNMERVILRGVVPGEYVVNVMMYSIRGSGGATVRVSLHKLRGADSKLFEETVRLEADGQEKTAFRFTLDANERARDFNNLPKSLLGTRSRFR